MSNDRAMEYPSSFFTSSLSKDNEFQDFKSFRKSLETKSNSDDFFVEKIPFTNMEKWHFDDLNGKISHDSGRFFSIEGIHVHTNFGNISEWDQPIIVQPEIGILGFITKIFNGIRYFLIQLKMEPGNINTLQLSPTVQATKSNFSMVHKGKRPSYVEYFNGEKKVKMLIDQLQSEQGSRFYQKRNRNMVIEVFDDISIGDDFYWLTLKELKCLLKENNIINMDTRSVLSTIPLIDNQIVSSLEKYDDFNISIFNNFHLSNRAKDFIISFITKNPINSIDDIVSWYTSQKVKYELDVSRKPLSQLNGWSINDDSIYSDKRYFSVIGVKVSAASREVSSWMQPLIEEPNIGLLAFVIKKINGILHFLVQAKVEPGNKDIIELSPSISCSNYKYILSITEKPFMFNEIFNPSNIIHYDSLQSEEGGRFYQVQHRNVIVELTGKDEYEIPPNYIWMTLGQINEFMRYSMFAIEARNIISAINFL
ncbi:dNDP-4-keto-6-deoxy-glucose-2,3- dehydratase [Spirochaetia bacterium]|nr:dNDP-4-keto-6-deoxy-glucose-2,3- dehydratase [Spirochaetia bacterium]